MSALLKELGSKNRDFTETRRILYAHSAELKMMNVSVKDSMDIGQLQLLKLGEWRLRLQPSGLNFYFADDSAWRSLREFIQGFTFRYFGMDFRVSTGMGGFTIYEDKYSSVGQGTVTNARTDYDTWQIIEGLYTQFKIVAG